MTTVGYHQTFKLYLPNEDFTGGQVVFLLIFLTYK